MDTALGFRKFILYYIRAMNRLMPVTVNAYHSNVYEVKRGEGKFFVLFFFFGALYCIPVNQQCMKSHVMYIKREHGDLISMLSD